MRHRVARLLARAVHLTHFIDLGYRRFDRLRSAAVTAFGSDQFFDEYNAVTYAASKWYRPDSSSFRRGLFDWEEAVVGRFFPAPPARVLVGGAGGGREALALIEKGYSVVAFDPAEGLIKALRARAGGETRLRTYSGSYADLPALVDLSDQRVVDLTAEPPFDAAIVGWSSWAHLRTDDERLDTLARFSRLTRGPILASYYAPLPPANAARSGGRLEHWIRKRMARHGHSVFSIDVGFYRVLSHAEVNQLLGRTGLTVLQSQQTGVWPSFVVQGMGSGGAPAATR